MAALDNEGDIVLNLHRSCCRQLCSAGPWQHGWAIVEQGIIQWLLEGSRVRDVNNFQLTHQR